MSIYVNVTLAPLVFSTAISGSMPNINIDADPIEFRTGVKGVFSSYPKADRNPDYDLIFDCAGEDRFGELGQGELDFATAISGSWLNVYIAQETLAFSTSISGTYVSSSVNEADTLAFDFGISGQFINQMPKTSWVKWSKIGTLDFTIDSTNVAGERPMEWTGTIYDILKHTNVGGVIIYGSTGIAEMKPQGKFWSYRTVYGLGTKGRNAQIATKAKDRHWFIDAKGVLFEISNGVKRLDYSEFLSSLNSPVLNLNEADRLLYICDNTSGYVYNYEDESMTKGYANLSGYGLNGGTSYVVSAGAITNPTIAFTTGIYDMGTRKSKTIFNLEITTAVAQTMESAISYRNSHKGSFVTTPWKAYNPNGFCILPCTGVEFQFNFRMSVYAAFSLDQFKINGVIHGFSFLDTVRKES